jgi:hypothetical protein
MSSQLGLLDLQAEHARLCRNNNDPPGCTFLATQRPQQAATSSSLPGTLGSKHRQNELEELLSSSDNIGTSSARHGLTAPASQDSLPTADIGGCHRPEPDRRPEGNLLDLAWRHAKLTDNHSTWPLWRTTIAASKSHSEVPDEEQTLSELVSDGNQALLWSRNAVTLTKSTPLCHVSTTPRHRRIDTALPCSHSVTALTNQRHFAMFP